MAANSMLPMEVESSWSFNDHVDQQAHVIIGYHTTDGNPCMIYSLSRRPA